MLFTKISCGLHFGELRSLLLFFFFPPSSVEDWWEWSLAWFSLPHPGWEGGQIKGQKWPRIPAPSFLVCCHAGRLLAVGRTLGGECVLVEDTHDHCGKMSLAREIQE